jgi:hypothetical protein
MATEIIYYTDNSLSEPLASFCREKLIEAAEGKRIISVSQKPLDFGDNFCIGEIGRSHLSIFRQVLMGLEQVKTKYVALAEHDCLYVPEHFNFIPPSDTKFYYNINCWFLRPKDGLYSYFRHKVLSMMIANTELTLKACREKVDMLKEGKIIRRGVAGACEFGVCENRVAYVNYVASLKDFGKDVNLYRAAAFGTKLPCLDIRHGTNFTGNRKTDNRTYELPYWGKWEDVWRK